MYVPQFYETIYKEDGTIASFTPVYEELPKTLNLYRENMEKKIQIKLIKNLKKTIQTLKIKAIPFPQ